MLYNLVVHIMSDDTEVVEKENINDETEVDDRAPDDMSSIVFDVLGKFPFFTVIIGIILYILSYSITYDTYVLNNMSSRFVNPDGSKSDSGIIVTGVLFGILLGLIEMLHTAEVI